MNYWKDCISIAADECGLELTKEQLETLADAVESGHENISNQIESRAQEELRNLKREKETRRELDVTIASEYQKKKRRRRRCDNCGAEIRRGFLICLECKHV